MSNVSISSRATTTAADTEFARELGLFDSTSIVVGSMIGSGIFIVSAYMAREIGSSGWLLVAWIVAGLLTLAAALSYGELASMMPRAGGQYVYLREAYSPLCGFLYGWTLFMVIQAGTIAAVAVGFGRYCGVLWPWVSEDNYLIAPVFVSSSYALSLSTTQVVAVAMIGLLTWTNTRGLSYGKAIQNLFTVAKTGALIALIVIGLLLGSNAEALQRNFGEFWRLSSQDVAVTGLQPTTWFGLFLALCVAQTGSLFAMDAWNNITFTAGEVKDPRRNIPLALGVGTGVVICLYLLANLTYLVTLPLEQIQHAEADRVATETLEMALPGLGASLMAIAIIVSTFGCNNGLILAGSRAYYAMARDGLFFRTAARLNRFKVPASALALQGIWSSVLVLPRTFDVTTGQYGNLYGDLLTYVISATLLFYILTIGAVFVLRRNRPNVERPYRAVGYPIVPGLYIIGATTIVLVLLIYQPEATWPGFAIVLCGWPAYLWWARHRPFADSDSGTAK